MSFVEQTSSSKFVVWDEYKEEQDKERQVLVKADESIIFLVDGIGDSDHFEGKKYLQATLMKLEKGKPLSTGEKVSITPPSYLSAAMGLNPDFDTSRTIAIGDVVQVTFTGRDASKTNSPYQFKLAYWEDDKKAT